MVNKEEIHHRLSEIREAIAYLGSFEKEIAENRDKFLLGRYYLQIMLEAVFTIGNQIISDANLRKPGSYRDIMQILEEKGIISKDLFKTLSPFAELRNRLVHTYWKISQDELLEIRKDLSPFEKFTKVVVKYIS
jgi:uncharacterized protein YutE (UPF0331/DUF86 family)